jgi:hypothetical protein
MLFFQHPFLRLQDGKKGLFPKSYAKMSYAKQWQRKMAAEKRGVPPPKPVGGQTMAYPRERLLKGYL